ncbi:MAG: tetratricopeptide repeat protein [Planctomycetota bacterium]|nr:tetratricopeptide repeat protein [Planctomycetota bacterium]
MTKSNATNDEPSRPTRIAALALFALVVWCAFAGALDNGWILFDDHEYVTRNPHVMAGFTWEGFTWFLRTVHVGNWHPLTSWSHMLDVELFGTSMRGPHAVNVALHTLTAVLVAHVLFLYTRRFWPSLCVAAVFALHPLRVESVAWIAERKDVLSGAFFVATLWAFRAFVDRPHVKRLVTTALLLLLGLMSKSMLVTAPFVLLLLDAWPLARTRTRTWPELVREKWPLFALSALFVVVTLISQSAGGATAAIADVTIAERLSTAATAYVHYLRATFWPTGLAPIYPYDREISLLSVLFSLSGLAIVTVVCVRVRTTRPHLFVGWAWFLGMLVPVIGLVQVGSQSHADRYTYLPSIGLAIALVFEGADFVTTRRAWRIPAVVAFGAVLFALVATTRAQTSRWRDTRTLFDHTLRVTQDNPVALKVYGDMLLEEGDDEGAIVRFEEALSLSPDLRDASKNLGCALAKAGRFESAAEHFRSALAADPSLENEFNLAWALSDAGQDAEAIPVFERVLARDEKNAVAHMRLGMVLANGTRFDEALEHWRRAIEIDPNDLDSRRSIARVQRARGEVDDEIATHRAVLAIDSSDVDTLVELARLLAMHPDGRVRNGAEAVRCAERARDVAGPTGHRILGTLAAAYAEAGRFEDAVKAAIRAVELAHTEGDAIAISRCEADLVELRAGRPLRTR